MDFSQCFKKMRIYPFLSVAKKLNSLLIVNIHNKTLVPGDKYFILHHIIIKGFCGGLSGKGNDE